MTYVLEVRVTPRSAKPGVDGWRVGADGRERLEVRVAEAPAGGAANEALVKLLARALGISRAEVKVVAGATSRHKRVAIPFELGEARRRLNVDRGRG